MGKKIVVVADPTHNSGLEILQKEVEVIYLPDLPGRTLSEEVKQANAIVVRGKTKVDRNLLDQADNLVVIAKHGVGYDNIDVQAAKEKGIIVVNTPTANTESVAEHNVGLILALHKYICAADRALRLGKFKKREDYLGVELKGKVLGVIGLGRIGLETARKCRVAFDMEIIGYDPYASKTEIGASGYIKMESMHNVLRSADCVVISVPLTRETVGLIGSTELNLMKASAFLVNSSRGKIINEDALYDHLFNKKIAGAALDVFAIEPPNTDHPLLSLDNFIATPHIAGVTAEAMERMSITVAEETVRVLRGEKPRYSINPEFKA